MYFYVFYINIIPLQTSTILDIKKAPLWAPIKKIKQHRINDAAA